VTSQKEMVLVEKAHIVGNVQMKLVSYAMMIVVS